MNVTQIETLTGIALTLSAIIGMLWQADIERTNNKKNNKGKSESK